jgi:hypothetical protein
MKYKDKVIDYKKKFKSINELVENTDSVFSKKYFSNGDGVSKYSPNFNPGTIYSFEYLTDSSVSEDRPYIDRNPIILCTDSYRDDGILIVRGIDLITVPPAYRIEILSRTHDYFSNIVRENDEVLEYKGLLKPLMLRGQNLEKLLFGTGYKKSFFGFRAKYIKDPKILRLEDWYKIPYLKKSLIEGEQINEIYSEYNLSVKK